MISNLFGTKKSHYQSINPFDNKLVESFEGLTEDQIQKHLKDAVTCYETWQHSSMKHRAEIVAKAASILRTRSGEFAHLITLEMGKLITQAEAEVALSADILDY